MKIPTRMPSGGCVLGICILGVEIRENPDTYAFWGLRFGYLHSRGCDSLKSRHVCLLGVAFWVFAFWGLRFVKIPTRMSSGGCVLGICILGVAIRENPDTYVFWGSHFGYLHLGVPIRENPDTYAFWGLHFGYLHSEGCDS